MSGPTTSAPHAELGFDDAAGKYFIKARAYGAIAARYRQELLRLGARQFARWPGPAGVPRAELEAFEWLMRGKGIEGRHEPAPMPITGVTEADEDEEPSAEHAVEQRPARRPRVTHELRKEPSPTRPRIRERVERVVTLELGREELVQVLRQAGYGRVPEDATVVFTVPEDWADEEHVELAPRTLGEDERLVRVSWTEREREDGDD